jgi:subtilisin family serine protease
MATSRYVIIHVTDHTNRPIEGAVVSAGTASAYTDQKGRARLEIAGGVEIQVDARGYEGQARFVERNEASRTQLFTLGRAGMPYYYRGKVKVPFEPLPGTIGVLAKAENAPDRKRGDIADAARRIGGTIIRSEGNFARSRIVVLRLEHGDEALTNRLRELTDDPSVEAAGAVVRLSENHASFLTNLVIARFAENVNDSSVAEIAGRHSLTPEGRFKALGNVHRLRFAGPATYAVIDAANALANEPQVIYAEPNLAATSEEDAIVPTDFLFLEQWDHQLINTPDAWQALHDIDTARTFGDEDLVVAVVDNGIDVTHPELSGNVSSGNPKQVALFDFANMVGNMSNLSTTAAQRDHGTACASAAVANTNNASVVAGTSEGIAGVAGNCRLIGILRGGTEARYAEMYLWAAGFDPGSTTAGFPAQLARGADVITNSFGFSVDNPISGLMSDTFDRLTDDGRNGRGVLLFFSAGNDNVDLDTTFRRPWSMYGRCFGVAASTLANDGVTEIKAAYSNFGTTVDWCAPSNDNEGRHNPPGVFGAHSATIQNAPNGDAVCGHPAQQTTLAAAAAAGATVLTLASAAGFAVGQAVLAGPAGGGAASGRQVTAVNAGANQITLDAGLGDALAVGAPVVAGPRSYRTDFGGTSYATPISAGTGALMLSANPQLHWDEVRDLIRMTAIKIDPGNTNAVGRWRDVNGLISTDAGYAGPNFSEFYGFGRLNTAAAVEAAGWQLALLIADAGNFGNVCLGSFEDLALTLSNSGPNTLTVTNIASSSGEFLVPNVLSYPLTIEPGNSLQVPIRLQPTSLGSKAATITVTCEHPTGPKTVDVSGTAGAPRLATVMADRGNFGDACVGSFADEPMTLSNSGHCTLTVTGISSSSSEFLVPNVQSYPINVEAGGSLLVPIRFQPTSFGQKSGTITVTSTDPTGPKSVAVAGNVPSGKLVVTGSTCIGGVKACCLGERTISICNVGDCKLHVTSVAFKRKSKHWKLINNPFPASLHPGSCLSVLIRYKATEKCPRASELVITSDDPNTPVKILDVMAYTIWSECGCKRCCDDCGKGSCDKRHDVRCSAQSLDPCCDDEGEEHEEGDEE